MGKQTILYGYTFPSYLTDNPRIKVGRTSGNSNIEPEKLADMRILKQGKTAHPEDYILLFCAIVPGNWVESAIHEILKEYGSQVIGKTTGTEWFEFKSKDELDKFINFIEYTFPKQQETNLEIIGTVSEFAFKDQVLFLDCKCGKTHQYQTMKEMAINDYGYAKFECVESGIINVVRSKNVDGLMYDPSKDTLIEYDYF